MENQWRGMGYWGGCVWPVVRVFFGDWSDYNCRSRRSRNQGQIGRLSIGW